MLVDTKAAAQLCDRDVVCWPRRDLCVGECRLLQRLESPPNGCEVGGGSANGLILANASAGAEQVLISAASLPPRSVPRGLLARPLAVAVPLAPILRGIRG